MTKSTFYADGYRDGLKGADYSPPDDSVYAAEYGNGYNQACLDIEPDSVFEGSHEGPLGLYINGGA